MIFDGDINGPNNANDAELEKQATESPDETTKLKEQIADLEGQLLRSRAELDNLSKRNAKQLDEVRQYAVTSFARDLLEVIDNLSRTVEYSASSNIPDELKPLVQGVEMTVKQLQSILERHGIKAVHANPGDAFDPNLHNALSRVQSSEHPDGAILSVAQAGYTIHGRLLRPAGVVVCSAGN